MKDNLDDSHNEINEKGQINENNEQDEKETENNEKSEITEKEESTKLLKKERISLENLFKIKINFRNNMNKGRTGLVNIGNTCFMNSALQCLSNCYELTKYFILNLYENDINQENKLGSGGRIAVTYRKLLEELWRRDEDYINPSYFKNIFAHFVRKFSGYSQQDSNEFLIYLLDKIHEDLNSISKKPYIEIEDKRNDESDEDASKRWWEKHLLRENSIIVDLFHGQFKSTITCNYCNRVAVSFDSFMFLSLPIPSGKYELNIKYFGYKISEYTEFIVPITENTTLLNIIEIIKKRLSNKKVNNNINNPPKKQYRNKKSNKNIKNKEIALSGDSIELVLLTKTKQYIKFLLQMITFLHI